MSDADAAAGQGGGARSGHHRTPHNQFRPSHPHTLASADPASRPGLHPAGRVWLQERGAHVFGPGAQELLHRLDETGSLNQAAKDMKMSYSKAWRMVGEIEQGLGVTLLARQTGGAAGGGSRLTDEGRLVLERFEAFTKDVDEVLEELFRRHFSDLPYSAPGGPAESLEGRRPSELP